MISEAVPDTVGMLSEVELQKGARSNFRGKLTCLLTFLRLYMVCWNRFKCIVSTAGGQKTSSCLEALL